MISLGTTTLPHMREERMGHEAEIIIPGSFVALQGTAGDGIINTLETPWSHHDFMDDDDDDDEIVLPYLSTIPTTSTTRRPLMMMTTTTTTTTATSTTTTTTATTTTSTDDSFVVVTDHEVESPREEFHRQCVQHATIQREEWKENARTMATEHLFWTKEFDFWWLQRGKVAILRDLPTQLSNGTILRSVIGTITPGTTIVATDICYLDSQTLQRLQVPPITSSGGSTHPHRIYPRGKQGWFVLVKVQLHGRTGYATLSVDGYPLLAPGLPSWYMDPYCWIWRVTCPVGAFVREGLDLNTHHMDTIPFGSLVRVTRRTINSQGFSRLRISAMVDDHADSRLIDGWCSEFLNPLSGNCGSVLTPLTFPLPARYKIVFPGGAVVRSQVELSTPSIQELSQGTMVAIKKRAFSEHPFDQCLDRLQLNTGGWISLKLNQPPPNDTMIVSYVDPDPAFDPETPHLYHQISTLTSPPASTSTVTPNSPTTTITRPTAVVHTRNVSWVVPTDSIPPGSPTCTNTTSNVAMTTTTTTTMEPHPQSYAQCVICLTQERNATIVHGETGHVACCLVCARILKARGDKCPVCRLPIDLVIQQFWA